MSESCVGECGRPASSDSYFCYPCWRKVPISEQARLYRLAEQIRLEPNNEKHQLAFQQVLDRAVKAVPA